MPQEVSGAGSGSRRCSANGAPQHDEQVPEDPQLQRDPKTVSHGNAEATSLGNRAISTSHRGEVSSSGPSPNSKTTTWRIGRRR